MEHDAFCNCEDCWWAHDGQEICSCCGSLDCHEEILEEEEEEENNTTAVVFTRYRVVCL